MFHLLVLLIIAGCVAYQYLKGTLVRAFATIIITICASIAAFGFFEPLAEIIIKRSDSGEPSNLVLWAQSLSFSLLFILVFAVLQTIANLLTRHKVDLGPMPERIGRIVCGFLLGLLLSGIVLTALALAPLANNLPYQRFDETNPDAENPGKALLNPDGLVTAWFSMVSNGSFSALRNKTSFAALHPDFLDQIFLNRHGIPDKIPFITTSQTIELPRTQEMPSWWLAPDNIEDQNGNLLQKSGFSITIVRVGIKKSRIRQAGTFTPSQLRLICKKEDFKNLLTGNAVNAYPIGYLTAENLLQTKKLNEKIQIWPTNVEGNVKWIDFAFYVPNGFAPALVEFKLNDIAEIKARDPAEIPPEIVPFEKVTVKTEDD